MNNPILLSYIVPVYNTAQWLPECLSSLIAHNEDEIEIIIIDDGSTDASSAIIRRYAAMDNRIVNIYQENRGLCAARNRGLQEARGKYVFFVDSDDIVVTKSLKLLLKAAQQYEADVVTGGILCFDKDNREWKWGRELDFSIYSNGAEYIMDVFEQATYFPMVFGYLIRRELIIREGIFFEKGLIHEDELWTPCMLMSAKKICVTTIPHYRYRTGRLGAITTKFDSFVRCLSLSKIISRLTEEFMSKNKKDEKIIDMSTFLLWRLDAMLAICRDIKNKESNVIFDLLYEYSLGHIIYFRAWLDQKLSIYK